MALLNASAQPSPLSEAFILASSSAVKVPSFHLAISAFSASVNLDLRSEAFFIPIASGDKGFCGALKFASVSSSLVIPSIALKA